MTLNESEVSLCAIFVNGVAVDSDDTEVSLCAIFVNGVAAVLVATTLNDVKLAVVIVAVCSPPTAFAANMKLFDNKNHTKTKMITGILHLLVTGKSESTKPDYCPIVSCKV
jgi:hypothetical protein